MPNLKPNKWIFMKLVTILLICIESTWIEKMCAFTRGNDVIFAINGHK